MTTRNAGAGILIAALLAGCGTLSPTRSDPEPGRQNPPPVNLGGYNAAFKQGYADGCASAGSSQRRNESRYKSDTDYMIGWNDGNSVCRKGR
jgi:hypothetical protein